MSQPGQGLLVAISGCWHFFHALTPPCIIASFCLSGREDSAKRQCYALQGVVALDNVNTNAMAAGTRDHTIKAQHNAPSTS